MTQRPEGPFPLRRSTPCGRSRPPARHGSVTRAADELCVTQTAVSHQVRLVEETLATKLFRRLPRRIELTEQGQAWSAALSDAFGRLYTANRRLRVAPQPARPTVAVSVLPSFASRCLVPRLGRFLEENPSVDVRISPGPQIVDFNQSEFDLGIRYGRGVYPGHRAEKLCSDAWVLVCAPRIKGRAKLRSARDLAHFTLLRDDDDDDAWRGWLARSGVKGVDPRRGPLLTDSSMVVEAAVQGQGVALVRLALAVDELTRGRLVQPFPRIPLMPTEHAYHLVTPRSRAVRPEVRAFCDWMRREVVSLKELGI